MKHEAWFCMKHAATLGVDGQLLILPLSVDGDSDLKLEIILCIAKVFLTVLVLPCSWVS